MIDKLVSHTKAVGLVAFWIFVFLLSIRILWEVCKFGWNFLDILFSWL